MVLLYVVFLVFFLDQCHGRTQFIYTAVGEDLVCDTNQWQINTESDNLIRIRCLVKCFNRAPLRLDSTNNTPGFCGKKETGPNDVKCSLKVRSGFFACVKDLLDPVDHSFLYPFRPSPNMIHSYIVAIPDPNITSTSEITTVVIVNKGESVLLNCSLNFTKTYERTSFVVYWIKTTGQDSTCVYSYDYNFVYGIRHGHHCEEHKDLIHRLSNRTKEPHTHNIVISAVMESDSGQYLCAVYMNKDDKGGKWKVISNITVSLHKDKTHDVNTDEMETGSNNRTAGNTSGGHLIPLCVTMSILLSLLVYGIIMRKTMISSRVTESQTKVVYVMQVRSQTGGDPSGTDGDCE